MLTFVLRDTNIGSAPYSDIINELENHVRSLNFEATWEGRRPKRLLACQRESRT